MFEALENYYAVRTANAAGITREQVLKLNRIERDADEYVPVWSCYAGEQPFKVDISDDGTVRVAVWVDEWFYEGVVRKDGTVEWSA